MEKNQKLIDEIVEELVKASKLSVEDRKAQYGTDGLHLILKRLDNLWYDQYLPPIEDVKLTEVKLGVFPV